MRSLAAVFASAARWLRTHRKVVLGVFVVLAIGILLVPGISFAEEQSTADKIGSWLSGMSIISLLAQLLNWIASGVGLLIVTLINVILVPILNYNGFATSPIVDLGWSLVRDTVNMFVVVILLVIAILTIVGSPRANWQQQIPRLFLFTIAVNFSRTICGVLIDLSNVIMFQFVNAILEVGAGNFAQLLQLNTFGDYSTLAEMAIMPWQNLAAAYLQLTMMLAVLAVILIMTIVYIYRIVVLWILIIMSPAAFFSGGIKDIAGPASGMYGEWWKQFSSALIMGPLLTFFLWLALAAAASGDIVAAENFPTGENETSFGIVLKVFEMSNITSLMIGLVLLVVGMQQAGKFASSMGGLAASLINEGMGQNIVKRAAKLPLLGVREVGRQADRRLGATLDRPGAHRGSLIAHLGAGTMGAGEALRTRGGISALAGRALSSSGDRMTRLGESGMHEATHNAQERVKNWSQERLQSELRIAAQQVANGQQPPLLYNRDSGDQAFAALMTKRGQQRDLEGQANTPQERAALDDILAAGLTRVQEHRDHLLEKPEEKDAFDASRTRYLDLHRNEDGSFNQNTVRDVVRDDKFKRGLIRGRALRFDTDDAYDRAQIIRQQLMDKTARVVEENGVSRRISEWEEMTNGNGVSSDLRDAAQALDNRINGVRTVYNAGAMPAGAQNAADLNTGGLTVPEVEAAIRGGTLNVNNITADNFDGPSGETIVQAMVNTGNGPQNLPNDAARNWFNATATDMANAGRLTGAGRGAVDNYNLDEENIRQGYSAPGNTAPREVFRDRSAGAAPDAWDVNRISEAVENNARAIRHLGDALAHPTQGQQVADAVSATVDQRSIQRLVQEWRNNPAPENRDQIRRAVQLMAQAMQRHMNANMPPRGMSWQDHNGRLAGSYDDLRSASARMGLGDPGAPPTR